MAQFAGGVPAMCDGITQGRAGMELSLFSRDVIAMATAVALSHDMFDAALLLGVCDKIVPGLLIGALAFGHLPIVLVPAGPMPLRPGQRARRREIRQRHAEGHVGRDELLDAEARAYHAPGTCTFYGTANSNQLWSRRWACTCPARRSSTPGTPLRDGADRRAARRRIGARTRPPLGEIVDERALVNAVVALLATGGSTNHTIHLVAIAAAAGIAADLGRLRRPVGGRAAAGPRCTRTARATSTHFHAAGGTAFLIGELLDAGLLHADVQTVAGPGLERYRQAPHLDEDGELRLAPAARRHRRRPRAAPRPRPVRRRRRHPRAGRRPRPGGREGLGGGAGAPDGRPPRRGSSTTRPSFLAAFAAGELDRDLVAVVRYQGPRANGMPELHKLIPALGVLLDRGHRVALVTDGRMSGASGKVPAAIHCTPEAAVGGPLARLRDGDVIRLDADAGRLDVDAELATREPQGAPGEAVGTGRELFAAFRAAVGRPDEGASVFARAGATAPAAPARGRTAALRRRFTGRRQEVAG